MVKTEISPMLKESFLYLFKKPATEKYPIVKPKAVAGLRGKQIFDITLCISCGLCSRDCPANAIEMVDVEGKKRPLFRLDLCIFCYQCADSCPRNAIISSGFFEMASTDKSGLMVKPQINQNVEQVSYKERRKPGSARDLNP